MEYTIKSDPNLNNYYNHKNKLFDLLEYFFKLNGSNSDIRTSIDKIKNYCTILEKNIGKDIIVDRALENFYENSLSDESLAGIDKTINKIKIVKAKLSMVGIKTLWTPLILNKTVKPKLVFRLDQFEKPNNSEIQYDDLATFYNFEDYNTDRIILILHDSSLTIDINNPHNYMYKLIMPLTITENPDYNKAIRLTPTTYEYHSLNEVELASCQYKNFVFAISERTMHYIGNVLKTNYENNKSITQANIKKLQDLAQTIKFNLNYLVDGAICCLKLLKDLKYNREVYTKYQVVNNVSVLTDMSIKQMLHIINKIEGMNMIYSILEDESKLTQFIKGSLRGLRKPTPTDKAAKIERSFSYIKTVSTSFWTISSERSLNAMFSCNELPDEFIQALQLLKESTIVEIEGYTDMIRVPELLRLVNSITVIRDNCIAKIN
jgi:hypothetical protein